MKSNKKRRYEFLDLTYHLFINNEDKLVGMFSIALDADIQIKKAKAIAQTQAFHKHEYAGQKVRFKWSEKLGTGKYLIVNSADLQILEP